MFLGNTGYRQNARRPATGPRAAAQRRMPVWPREYRPGWGHRHSPCGPLPTFTLPTSWPDEVLIAYTSELDRPASHRIVPSADTPPMSGLPPPGMCQVAVTLRVAKSITETDPSPRLET